MRPWRMAVDSRVLDAHDCLYLMADGRDIQCGHAPLRCRYYVYYSLDKL